MASEEVIIFEAQTYVNNNKTIKDVLNIYEKAKKKHIDNFTEETKYIITENDIEKPVIKLNIKH